VVVYDSDAMSSLSVEIKMIRTKFMHFLDSTIPNSKFKPFTLQTTEQLELLSFPNDIWSAKILSQ
jgi:hypothetical protein